MTPTKAVSLSDVADVAATTTVEAGTAEAGVKPDDGATIVEAGATVEAEASAKTEASQSKPDTTRDYTSEIASAEARFSLLASESGKALEAGDMATFAKLAGEVAMLNVTIGQLKAEANKAKLASWKPAVNEDIIAIRDKMAKAGIDVWAIAWRATVLEDGSKDFTISFNDEAISTAAPARAASEGARKPSKLWSNVKTGESAAPSAVYPRYAEAIAKAGVRIDGNVSAKAWSALLAQLHKAGIANDWQAAV